jgi:PAS domain S-box-containing protein
LKNTRFLKNTVKSIQENINLKIGLSFFAVFALLITIMLVITSIIFKNIIDSSENRLSENITNVLSISISRISFSGKYHAQIFSDQLIEKESAIKYIVILDSNGETISKSYQPDFKDFIDKEYSTFLKTHASQASEISKTGNRVRYVKCCNEQSIKEIIMPYHGSFDQGQIGIIIAGISMLKTNSDIVESTLFLIFLAVVITVVGLLLIYVVTNKISYPIRRQATMFQGILDYSPMLVMVKDKKGDLLAVSDEYKKNDVVTQGHINQIFNKEIEYWPASDKTLKDIKTSTGDLLTFLTLKFPLFDKLGSVYGVCGIATDVTEDQKNQKALLKSESEFRSIFESSPVGIANIDRNGFFVRCNPSLQKILGYSNEELRKLTFNDITYADDIHKGDDLWTEMVNGKLDNAELDKRYVRKDGRIVWTHISASAIRNKNGDFIQTVTLVENVTERREAEELRNQLFVKEKEARLDAQRAVLIRDEFLSIASHELKTPLTVLMMQTQLLNRLMEQDRLQHLSKQKQLELIQSSSQQLDRFSNLINDLLDVGRLSEGALTLKRVRINLYDIVQGILPRFQQELVESGSMVSLSGDSEVIGEWERLPVEQVIINLLKNAIKFGLGKEIKITIEKKGIMAVLTVSDHGIGISTEDQGRIFECFERGVSSKSFGGLGLGLYISRQFIEAHGGTIKVESELNHGSTFIVELPLFYTEALRSHNVNNVQDVDSWNNHSLVTDVKNSTRDF